MISAKQLKASVLHWAIQGKLTEQRESDGNAAELLEKIFSEKIKAATVATRSGKRAGKASVPAKPTPIPTDEIPFQIPKNWTWCRLGDVIKIITGTSYQKTDVKSSGIRILRGGNILDEKILFEEDDVFLPKEFLCEEKTLHAGDIAIVASTGSKVVIGKPGFAKENFPTVQIGAFLRIIRPQIEVLTPFIQLIFRTEYYREHVRESSSGTNINNIKNETIQSLPFPLPPLAEQKRIVARVEKILAALLPLSR